MNMGKHVKIFLVTLVVALFGVLAVGCGSSATAEPQAAAPQEVFKLKFTSPLPAPPFLISETIKWWADEVAVRSDGRIEWTDFYWLGALTKAGETIEALQVGLADAGMGMLPASARPALQKGLIARPKNFPRYLAEDPQRGARVGGSQGP